MTDPLVHMQLAKLGDQLTQTNELLEAIRLEIKRARLESERLTNAVRELSANAARRAR